MATSRKDKAQRSPRCNLTRVTLTIKGHGDLSSTENQARFAAALLGLPQPTDFSPVGIPTGTTPSAIDSLPPDARAGEGE
ncbi:hypothetical protein [Deinococcus sp. QL22]|uniref:hypothetical protein n=1 Tax=Deinococcus sp. QL22 TaxID=2939437 RepID=UPI002016D64F|nr:hypothetical protein [Deinococcus sp. QL22]UQN10838.1 hypothetical protein M1R55_31595 [Deinococcus sp. QL22]